MTPLQIARSLALANALEQPLAEPFNLTSICRCAIGQCGPAVGFRLEPCISVDRQIREFFGLDPDLFLYGEYISETDESSNQRGARIYGLNSLYDLAAITPQQVAAKIREHVAAACPSERHTQIPEPLRSIINGLCPAP